MSLFQPSVLKKYLSQQDTDQVQKAYKKYSKYFHNAAIQENIRNSKEEQFQEGFLRELFVDILGYTLNPTPKFNLTTELKNIKGSKKVDGAILKDGNALAVIELKGTNTKDMESIRQQAFDYKANQTGCIYVITSNFEKLRFYVNNAVDFEEFNLFTLNLSEFEIFYLCLAKDNILSNKPLSIKEASVVEEENITKKFYADYSLFKRELYRDLVKQNRNNIMLTELSEKTSKLTLFKKSQKLIDRFLFILFAEDRGLLAPNSINTILKEWKALADLDMDVPLYDRYKQYFRYLDTGRKGTDKKEEIFAYNGGLFQPDTILDAVVIDSELLYRHTKKLSTYDFESQVDVNILGHIFEHSLNEIESVNAEIEGTDFDKQKTKRKKDGVFYTPKYITKYIVDNTVGKLCTDKKLELGIIDEEYAKGRKNRQSTTIIKLEQQLKDYREWLLELTICDPACGSGAFLNQALDFLIREHAYIDELNKQLFGGGFAFPDIENQILEHNIYGVDLNEESIEIAKLSLWLRTAQPKRKLTSLNNNIKCGNSLIDSKAVAGDKAFNWKEQFPEVFAKGGFDVIIGNPPYVNIVNISNKNEREFYQKNYETVKNKSDLYSIFIEKGFQILKQNGDLSFIFPNSWLGTESFSKLRKYLIENTLIEELVKLPNDVFDDAVVTPLIIIFRKVKPSDDDSIALKEYVNSEFKLLKSKLSYARIKSSETNTFSFVPEISIKTEFVKLGKIADFSLGIKTSDDSRFIFNTKINSDCFPILRGRNISKYYYSNDTDWIWYKPELITEKAGGRPRILQNFLGEKIYIQDISKSINACYCDEEILANDTLNVIYKVHEGYHLKTIMAFLNSNFVNKWFESNFQEGLHIKINQLQQIPIPKTLLNKQQPFIEKVDLMLEFNKQQQFLNRKFSNYFSGQYKLEKLPKKLENWHELTFADFITVLNKAIKTAGQTTLTKKDEFEWLDLFEENKTKAQNLKSQIETTEKAIDKMVYELYGLSEEEIEIIENS